DGNRTLSDVTVADPLCAPVFASGDGNGDGLLDVGEAWTYTCTYAVTQSDIDGGAIVNTATAQAMDGQGRPVSGQDSAIVVSLLAPHLTLTKTASVETVLKAGDPITYTVTVVNDGNQTLGAVNVTDPLCQPQFVSGDADLDGLLDTGETWTYSCTYTTTQADVDAGS